MAPSPNFDRIDSNDIDPDYLDPVRYDRYYGPAANMPDWFIDDLTTRGNALELACGTGRIAIPLAQQGVQISGLDYSQPMLDLARAKAEARSVQVEWISADMRSFDTGQQYGTILLGFNALWHLHRIADFMGCMQSVRRHLTPGGRFVLDVFVPGLEFLTRDPNKRYPGFEYTDDNNRTVRVTQSYRYEADTQIARTVHYHENTDIVVGGLNLRLYFPQELDALLAWAGLEIVDKFGDWERTRFGATSQHQLCICSSQ